MVTNLYMQYILKIFYGVNKGNEDHACTETDMCRLAYTFQGVHCRGRQ